MKATVAAVLGTFLALTSPPRRDERGLSTSTETVILVAGALTLGAIVVSVITAYVKAKLPK